MRWLKSISGTILILAFCASGGTYAQSSIQKEQEEASERSAKVKAEREKLRKVAEDGANAARNSLYQTRLEFETRNAAIRAYYRLHLREPSPEELKAVPVPREHLDYFETLRLSAPAGVIALLPERACGLEGSSAETIAWCERYSMPGNGSRYSFRERRYREAHLADISYEGGFLKAGSKSTLGFLTKLGNQPLSEVDAYLPSIAPIWNYTPPSSFHSIESEWKRFDGGVSINNYSFCRRILAEVGQTYVLRTIAFRSKSPREAWGFTFDEFDYDKRRDLVVAFEVRQRTDQDGLIIVWRVLRDMESPKLR